MNPVNLIDMLANPNFAKEADEALIKMFSSRIKESFLRKVYKKAWLEHPDFYRYYNMGFTIESLASGTGDNNPNYELCRNIVSIHRFNCIGLTDSGRAKAEASDAYCDNLIGQVTEQIRIRAYAGAFFRNKRISTDEDYIFFPPAYKLFAICQRGRQILLEFGRKDRMFIVEIFGKIMSALILIEDGLLANAYPSARAAIEIYLRWLVLLQAPQAEAKYQMLSNIQLQKYCNDGDNPPELQEAYNNEAKHKTGILPYMNFGWVDDIPDYENYVNQKHYSIDGLITYIKMKIMESQSNEHDRSLVEEHFDLIKIMYSRCHAYTHGNITVSNYSLLEFTDLTVMLCLVGRHTYATLADDANQNPNIVIEKSGINENILAELDKDRRHLHWILENKSDNLFKTFHNYKK